MRGSGVRPTLGPMIPSMSTARANKIGRRENLSSPNPVPRGPSFVFPRRPAPEFGNPSEGSRTFWKKEGHQEMAATDADRSLPDLLPQIHALFSDQLRVISYKWLSRNFSVSSNDAKRLLQEFVIKHGTDIQVIYSVSGWLKDSAQTYCVKLTSGPKLEEARQEFKDSCSVQVYSIQACIPKDTAVLWNPEFVQAEELFNQPFDEDNCLRDNRFCGVVNSFVKRATKGKHVSSLPPKPVNSVAAAALSKPSSASKEQSVTGRQQGLPEPSSPKKGTGSNTEKDHTSVLDKSANAPVIKEPSIVVNANKNGKNGKTLPSNGGSLATMWGRASAKPKTPATTNSTDLPSIPVTADAQICAKEEANAESSDDEQGVHYKRSSSGSNNRKRRAVFDLSDDDEEDNVVAIASPEPPKQCVANPVTEAAQDSKPEQKELESKQVLVSDLKGFTKGPESDFTSECKTKSDNTINHSGITLKEKSNDPPVDDNKQDHAAKTSSTSPKKRKVLKTRIDDRGREVTEVVWEGESSAGDQAENNVTSTDATSRPTILSKPQPATNPDRNNASSKTAGSKKPAKAAPKQGKNILSFFKKI